MSTRSASDRNSGADAPERWRAYRYLCDCLAELAGRSAVPFPQTLSWEALIEMAGRHAATPALGWALRERCDVPAEVRQYFDAVRDLNLQRNRAILAALSSALRTLDAGNVPAILLKGSASLASGLYPDPSIRILSDIDILVPVEKVDMAEHLLRNADFSNHGDNREFYKRLHHGAPLRHDRTGIFIEIHHRTLRPNLPDLIPAAELFRDARSIDLAELPALIPSATHRFAHALAHTQIQDENHKWASPDLRQMLELAMLRQHEGNRIDWTDLVRRFGAAGGSAALRDTLEILRALFGVSLPPQMPAPAHDPLRAIRRRVVRNSRFSFRALSSYVRAVPGKPAMLLKVFHLQDLRRVAALVWRPRARTP